MDVKFVLAIFMLGAVDSENENNIYVPLVRLESVRGSESNCDIKEYLEELFVNMSRSFSCKYEPDGKELATKDDIREMKNAFIELKRNFNNMSAFIKDQLKPKPIDCKDIKNTSDGEWIVIQRRVSNSDFYKPWSEYEAGFGNLSGNFWLGLRNIHLITQQAKYVLRVDLSSMDGETAYAYYDEFSVGAAESYYKLTIGGYSGTAGDSLTRHNGMKFSTYDQDNDIYSRNCAVLYHGAWWYEKCHSSNLNGDYGNTDFAEGPVWEPWKGYYSPLKTTKMKIRRIG